MGSLLASLLTFSTAFAATGYLPIGGHDGVEVFQRNEGGLVELAAVGEIDAPPATVQAALLDYGAHPRIIARLAESQVIARRSGELFVYQHLKLPTIKDRDYTLRVEWQEGAPRGLQFQIDPAHGPAASNKAVRMPLLSGQWVLEPIRGGQATRATYHVQLDFGGSVPRWMVRGGAAKDLPNTYVGFRRLVSERRLAVAPAASNSDTE